SVSGGGPEQLKRRQGAVKLTVPERLSLLFDAGSFVELGALAHSEETKEKPTPADGCVTGIGKIAGRPAAVIAYDFTVLAGSIGLVGERKATRIRELAMTERIPLIWLLDSAGARSRE